MKIRSPIVSVLGHVDHGKTTLLDYIRGSTIAAKEAGGITQHIGATEIPNDTIENICGDFISKLAIKDLIPGLFFIDTPGHAAFTSLRKRGGALADLAVLILDVNDGFKPQTYEALNILKMYKTPFIVVANKIDRLLVGKFMKVPLLGKHFPIRLKVFSRIWTIRFMKLSVNFTRKDSSLKDLTE